MKKPKPRDEDNSILKQELYCHSCGHYVQFELDMTKQGNHVLECPNCGHEHCRVIKNGRITNDRWSSKNGATYNVFAASHSTSSNTSWFTSASCSSNYIGYTWCATT